MATSVKEYKQKNQKLVTVPSGATFLIRSMPIQVSLELIELGPILDTIFKATSKAAVSATQQVERAMSALTAEQKEALSTLYSKVLTTCIVEPKVALTATDEDTLSILDINSIDQMHLLNEIFKLSPIKEAVEQAKK